MTADSSKLRVAVIGVGAFGRLHVEAYRRRKDVELVAVADADPARAQEVAGQYGVPAAYSDHHRLFEEAAPDAVSVATSEDAHLEPTLAALAAGIWVLLEKPTAANVDEAKELLRAEQASSAGVVPAHILRFAAPYRALLEEVRAGSVGRVLAIGSRRDREQRLSRHYTRAHPAFLTLIHDIDQVLWLSGDRARRVRAVEVRADTAQPVGVWAHVEMRNGILASMSTAYLYPDDTPPGNFDRLDVYGTAGVGVIDLGSPRVSIEGTTRQAPDIDLTPKDEHGALGAEIEHFCECARLSQPSDVVTLDDALEGIRIAAAVVESAGRGGEPVILEDDAPS